MLACLNNCYEILFPHLTESVLVGRKGIEQLGGVLTSSTEFILPTNQMFICQIEYNRNATLITQVKSKRNSSRVEGVLGQQHSKKAGSPLLGMGQLNLNHD